MGSSRSKELTSSDIKEIADNTHFGTAEVKAYHRTFIQDFPKGVLDENQFIAKCGKMCPNGDASLLAKEIFRCCDKDGNGEMSFGEFMEMLSIITRGSRTERLSWTYSLFDKDNDGAISKKELLQMLYASNSLRGTCDFKDIEKEVDSIFSRLSKDKEATITRDDFMLSQNL